MNRSASSRLPPSAASPRAQRLASAHSHQPPVEEIGDWPAIAAALDRLRAAGRHSIRIVDANCGAGDALLRTALYARRLGFTAIEARGIDGVPRLIAEAQAAAAGVADPAIGIGFEVADLVGALAEEADVPADIVLWHRHCDDPAAHAIAVAATGRVVIDAHGVHRSRDASL